MFSVQRLWAFGSVGAGPEGQSLGDNYMLARIFAMEPNTIVPQTDSHPKMMGLWVTC